MKDRCFNVMSVKFLKDNWVNSVSIFIGILTICLMQTGESWGTKVGLIILGLVGILKGIHKRTKQG